MQSAAPITSQERIHSLDVVRGVALLGILLMNITVYGMPLEASLDPSVWGGATGVNLWTWITTEMLFEGTQRGLFTLLFGAGVIVFTGRLDAAQSPHAPNLFFRRYLWLIAFGLVHGFVFLWIGDVLFVYGVIALFVYGFRWAAPKTLLLFALGGFILNAGWNQLDVLHVWKTQAAWQEAVTAQKTGATLTVEQTKAITAWNEHVEKSKPDAHALQEQIEARRGSYLAQAAFQAPIRNQLQITMVYRAFFDFFSMMLIGMALFKSGLLQVGRPLKIYWRMVLIGYGVGLIVNFLEVRYVIANDFSVLALARARVSYDIGRAAMTAGHIGLLMLFCNAPILAGVKRRLAAVGQMALTSYVSHSVICAFVFCGIGFGLFGQLQRHQLYYVVAAVWAFQLIVSPIWLRHFRFGPLEWLWRSLTYGQPQPMRRSVMAAVAAPS